MSDKPLPTFSFGAPASTASNSQPLFGTAGSSTNTGGSLFGTSSSGLGTTGSGGFGSNKPSSGGSGFSFGSFGKPAGTASASGETPKPLFGAPAENKASNPFGNPSTSSEPNTNKPLFGAAPASSSTFSGFSFGNQKPEEKKQDEGTTSPFSGFGNNVQTPGKTSGPDQLGLTTPAPNPFFGNQSTTPAGPPPTTSTFGASTGGGGLSIFGNKSSQAANTSSGSTESNPAPSLFGAPQTSKTSAAPNIFGSKPAASPFTGFGSPPVTSTANTSTITTSAEASKPAFSFGNMGGSSAAASSAFAPVAQPATTTTTKAQAPSSIFGGLPTSGANSNSSSGFSFPSTNPAPSAPQQKPLFGGFNTNTTTSSATPTFPSFAPPKTAASSTAVSSGTTTATTTTAPAPSPFSFGPATTSASGQPPTNTTASPAAASAPAPASGFTATASTAGPRPDPQSRLKNKTMDEILTRWAADLTKYTKEFRSHADTVSQWDMTLVENLLETQKLYGKTVTSEKQMQSVEMALSAVESQQDQLEHWLSKYERDVDEMLEKQGGSAQQELGGPDQEREKTYKLAEKLGERLDDMGRDLQGMIEEVNDVTAGLSKNGKGDEPITQIVKILNSHLTQLQDIDRGTNALQAKVTSAQQEASRSGLLNGTSNGDGRAAVEDFYRSYMGRR